MALNPTRHEDAVLDAFNHAITALNTRKLGRDVARAEMSELGLVVFPGLHASVTIDEGRFEATIGPDAEVVYEGTLAASAVAMIIARFANQMALQAIEAAGQGYAPQAPSLPRDWRCPEPTCRRNRSAAGVDAFGVVTCAAGHESM